MSLKRNAEVQSRGPARKEGPGYTLWLILLTALGLLNTFLLVLLLLRPAAPPEWKPATRGELFQQEAAGGEAEELQPDEALENQPEEALQPESLLVAEPDPPAAETESERPPVEAREPSSIRLQVLNGTDTPRLAARLAEALTRKGYDVREKGNARRHRGGETLVLSRDEDSFAALQVASELGLGADRILIEIDPELVDVDVSIVIGSDHLQLRLP